MSAPKLTCLDAFSAHLIQGKAKKLVDRAEFSASDHDDLIQEFALDLERRRSNFNPRKASWPAFVAMVIDHKTATILEHRRAAKRSLCNEASSLNQATTDDDGRECEFATTLSDSDTSRRTGRQQPEQEAASDLALELATVLETLPTRLRRVCEALTTTCRKSQAARDLGISRQSLYEAVAKIRQRFEDAGLRDYL